MLLQEFQNFINILTQLTDRVPHERIMVELSSFFEVSHVYDATPNFAPVEGWRQSHP
jgi:hypothetical protein